ncbi:GNAT family N-acetyltransferase [Chitinimonas sp. JJ19]|uniref:GNAT family N-acetyltransferase n=1 Tax=Chitinimonas sp. JJ19 TaxID=3109352 RepID=UPI003003A34F
MQRPLRFATIDLERHLADCLAARRDTYIASFGSEAGWAAEYGSESDYPAWLAARIAALPQACVHVWDGDRIIGQLEGRLRPGSDIATIHLVYLVPAYRGTGAAAWLIDYLIKVFEPLGVARLQLSVAPGNARAIAFYHKHGWALCAQSGKDPRVRLMERLLPATLH